MDDEKQQQGEKEEGREDKPISVGGHMDTKNDHEDDNVFCTFAVTGHKPAFQAIFVCNDCFQEERVATSATATEEDTTTNDNERTEMSPLCICQACADSICHEDHDVEYIGMGPATCDCNHIDGCCKIYDRSIQEAERLGIIKQRRKQQEGDEQEIFHDDDDDRSTTNCCYKKDEPASMTKEVLEVPFLQDATINNFLVHQAKELIRHTKETHWVDEKLVSTCTTKLCQLESLAWSIYQHHRHRYETILNNDDEGSGDGGGGAEWWVQVKDTRGPPSTSSSIDLHYDKDEALATSFGLGSFPTFSTVTYLTSSASTTPPTVIFDHTYTQGEEEIMTQMLTSRPRIGKHLIFDGKLLHGAPYHPSLLLRSATIEQQHQDHHERTTTESPPVGRNQQVDTSSTAVPGAAHDGDDDVDNHVASVDDASIRVTFLVNIWKERRPANVHVLDDSIRQSILENTALVHSKDHPAVLEVDSSTVTVEYPLMMNPLTVQRFLLQTEDNLPKDLQVRIQLPFVSDKVLVGEMDDCITEGNEANGLVVVTFPPPPTDDTILVNFGPGMQAYLDYVEEINECNDVGRSGGTKSSSPPQSHLSQSDYV
jgi:hypothetical protein